MEMFLNIVRLACIVLLSALAGAGGLYLAIQPMQQLNATQAAVMREYLNAFCLKDEQHDRSFIIGQAAVMSRIVVKTNLGNLALLEYAKCKAGL